VPVKTRVLCVASDFRRKVDETCAVLDYYAEYSGSSLPTFRDTLSFPSSRVKKSKKKIPRLSSCVMTQKSADLKVRLVCFAKGNLLRCDSSPAILYFGQKYNLIRNDL
jgi:hypothetical protein